MLDRVSAENERPTPALDGSSRLRNSAALRFLRIFRGRPIAFFVEQTVLAPILYQMHNFVMQRGINEQFAARSLTLLQPRENIIHLGSALGQVLHSRAD